MNLHWRLGGEYWQPEGGERRHWRDVQAGDLLIIGREVWRVIENRPDPAADWDEEDRRHFEPFKRQGASEEEWQFRPRCLVAEPARGGGEKHFEVKPYRGRQARTYVLHPHYPVCADCGKPWPCPELDITREVRKQSKEFERLAAILPGCCWGCGEPVTRRQMSVQFGGENLLLPGGAPPVFHLRAKGTCAWQAMKYEEQWVAAEPGRKWRLQCPGRMIRHLDGGECDAWPDCPGTEVKHRDEMHHSFREVRRGGRVAYIPVPGMGAEKCRRCLDAAELRAGAPAV